jgi:hypothetical protein
LAVFSGPGGVFPKAVVPADGAADGGPGGFLTRAQARKGI